MWVVSQVALVVPAWTVCLQLVQFRHITACRLFSSSLMLEQVSERIWLIFSSSCVVLFSDQTQSSGVWSGSGSVLAEMMESCLAWRPERGVQEEVEDIKRNLLGEFTALQAQVGVPVGLCGRTWGRWCWCDAVSAGQCPNTHWEPAGVPESPAFHSTWKQRATGTRSHVHGSNWMFRSMMNGFHGGHSGVSAGELPAGSECPFVSLRRAALSWVSPNVSRVLELNV